MLSGQHHREEGESDYNSTEQSLHPLLVAEEEGESGALLRPTDVRVFDNIICEVRWRDSLQGVSEGGRECQIDLETAMCAGLVAVFCNFRNQ